jgi:DNA methylase
VEIHTTDGKTKDVRFDTSWLYEAERVADLVLFTIHPDALIEIWARRTIGGIKPPSRIGVWTIGDQGRFGITATSANLILAYGYLPGLRSLPDVIVAPAGDYHWPPSEIHPSPGSYYLSYQIIEHLKPKSVLDPFMGSGVTLHAAMTSGCEEIVGIDLDEGWIKAVSEELLTRGISPE